MIFKRKGKWSSWLLLMALLGQVLIQPGIALAEELFTDSSTPVSVQSDTGLEKAANESEEKSYDIDSSIEYSNNDQEKNKTQIDQSEEANANDSPTNFELAPFKTNEELQKDIDQLLAQNGLRMDENGKLYITSETSYRNNIFEVLQKIDQMKQQNQNQAQASLFSGTLFGNGIVVVPASENLSGVKFTRNNVYEFGWYGKKTSDGRDAYCIEPGVPLNVGNNPGYVISETTSDRAIKASLVDYYGHYKQPTLANKFYTESLINEVMYGYSTTIHTDLNGQVSQSGYESFKKDVMAKVNTFYTKPSFAGQTVTLKVGESKTLTDTNKSISYYAVGSNKSNVQVSIVGNSINLKATSSSNETGSIIFKYVIDTSYQRPALIYNSQYTQNVFTGGTKDPVSIDIKIKVEKNGNAKVKKVDAETGEALPGAKFKFTTSDGKSKELTTGKDGTAAWNDLPVGTKVTITEIASPEGYVIDKTPQTITIKANETTTVTFNNKKQLGTISIDKSGSEFGKDMPNGNYSLKGNTFEVYAGSKATGTPVTTITTDEKGQAKTKALPLGTYTLKETAASEGYILNENTWTVELTYAGQNVEITNVDQQIENKEQLADLTVIKEDKETGSQPQGAATLIGAEYTLTDSSGQVVGTMVMQEKNGVVQSELKGLKLGTYTLKETKAPEGYNLDPTEYEIKLTYAGQNETVALHSKTVTDQVIKGHIEGYKFGSRPLIPNTLEDLVDRLSGTNQDIKPPLEGVELTATSHTTGQKYVEVTGENGYFKFENLPYDTYTIEETKGIDGYLLIEPFEVTISEEGYTHFFLLEDRIIESKIHIVKVDEETGENIPYAGAQFKIFDTWANDGEGAFVSMQRPNDTESTELFETNEKGEIVTTGSLAWGIDRYELHEVKAPEGYVAMEEPIVFSVTEEDADALIRLEVPNRLARQDVQLIKKDRLNEQPLANVPFKLYQIENDGAETLIDEFVTDEKGMISIEGLPYGKYKFVEGQPLPGYLELEEDIEFSVTVENDGELIVLEAVNEREDLEITTLFASVDGQKEIDPTVDNQLKDTVWVKGDAIEIGHTYTVVTKYKNTETGAVVSEDTSRYTAKSKDDTFEVYLDLKANTLKDGDRLTATHTIYYEEEQENEVGKEDDLSNKEQTVTFRTPKRILPKTGATTSIYLTVAGLFLFVLGTVLLFKRKNSQ